MSTVAAIIVAGGKGTRVGGTRPKQYLPLGHETVVRWSLATFAKHPQVGAIQPVIHPDDKLLFETASAGLTLLPAAPGGATRQASVRAGLAALAAQRPDIVLVHDAARPFASATLVSRAIAAVEATGAAIPALPVTDTIKRAGEDNCVAETLARENLRLVQTPQAFDFQKLRDAHDRAEHAGRHDFPDDAALAEWAGLRVSLFEGEPGNIKLTTPDDFVRAEMITGGIADIRTGQGIDVHAFGPGDYVTLGGVRIPHDRGLSGHSDADVVLHAAVDAILGALAEGDIGSHFPPSDPQWRGASSDRFLRFAIERLAARRGKITHLDISIVCEAPRIGPHRDAMRSRIAEIAGIAADRVAVKATTSEGLGFTGRGEGIAAFATATIRLPS
jgi:2-C-methyl-D-erythritol 4-phosphate cytidylyltransferase / 2-C-methyl-D-erythritol 2,4-cyclodiphosphate synthase